MVKCCEIEAIGDVELHSKSQSQFRWAILVLICLMMMGDYYCYDIPAALKSQLGNHMGNPSDFETSYALLYSVYAIPNIVIPFAGGYLIDRWGCKTCMIIFSAFLVIGQVVFTIGFESKSWWIMYVGRGIYSLGGPNLNVGGAALISQWFDGYELSFAFGVSISTARIGSVVNNLISPRVADSDGLDIALWFGCVIAGGIFLGALAIYPLDKGLEAVLRASQKLREQEDHRRSLLDQDEEIVLESYANAATDNSHSLCGSDTLGSTVGTAERSTDADTGEARRRSDKAGMEVVVTPYSPSPAAPGAGADGLGVSVSELSAPVAHSSKEEVRPVESVRFVDVLNFPHVYWCVALTCVFVYGCVWPFNNVASTLLLERNYFMEQPNSQCALTDPTAECENALDNPPNQFCNDGQWYQPPLAPGAVVDCSNDPNGCYSNYCDGQSHAEVYAAMVMSIPYSIAVCLCPLFGILLDNYGYRGLVFIISPAMLVVVHLLLGYTQVEPISLLVGLGVAYAMYAATFWSSVSLLVKKHHTGLAYGIVISMFNVGMSCFPMMVAWVYTTSNDHYIPYVELCFVELAALALIIGVYINYYDNRHDNTLNMRATLTIPERERRSTHSSNHYSDFSYDGLLQGTSTLTGANRVSTEAIKYSFVR